MRVLLTGGAGYIGSHTALALLEQGHDVVVFDNLSNSSVEAVRRVEKLTGRRVELRVGDLLDPVALDSVFSELSIESVIHFAGLKSVGESATFPVRYYMNNVTGTLHLLECMERASVRTLVFSSSATVYGLSTQVPLTEDVPRQAINPYGRSKEQIEEILEDLAVSDDRWSIAVLRYFNPVGAHESGLIGEDPKGTPNNLLPFVAQVAVGRLQKVRVFGNDYPTADGTGVRDYIHVMDLASGHVAALDHLTKNSGIQCWNLGTGHGASVLEVINAFAEVSGRPVPYEFAPRRQGDAAVSYAEASRAQSILGWSSQRNLLQMCEDHWRWQSQNPMGYDRRSD